MRARARIPARALLPIILPRASPDSSVPSVASQDDKPIPKLLKAMLDFDPETRASAAEALAMLPGIDKMGVTLPTTGKVYLPPPPESSAEPLATEAATLADARRNVPREPMAAPRAPTCSRPPAFAS